MKTVGTLLTMLKEDIKKCVKQKAGIGNNELLTGQTITEEEIISLPAYKLMTPDERKVVHDILESMRKDRANNLMTANGSQYSNPATNGAGMSNQKVLTKRIDGIIPFPNNKKEQESVIEYKDAA